MPPQTPADPLDALAAQHGAVVAAGVDPLDALAQVHGAVAPSRPPDFHTDVNASDSKDFHGTFLDQAIMDGVIGVVKGAGSTAANLGRLALHTPIVGRFLKFANEHLSGATHEQQEAAFAAATEALKGTNLTQSTLKGAEQLAELVVPSNTVAAAGEKAATVMAPRLTQSLGPLLARVLPRAAIEAPAAAAMASAQGGSPVAGAVLGAAGPLVSEGLATALPQRLKDAAQKKVVQALGPTKERFKAMAERLAPEMLKRGLGGSRQALQQKAVETLEVVGDDLDQALATHGGQPVTVDRVSRALETAKDAFRTTKEMTLTEAISKKYVLMKPGGVSLAPGSTMLPNGLVQVMVEFEPRAIRQLSGLQKVIDDLGPVATVEQMTGLRRAWDKVVAQAGGYAHRAGGAIGVPLQDQSEAFAKREGAGAIRKLLADEVPDLAAINKEYSFWKNLDDVLTQTLQRTQAQAPGLGKQIAEVGGAAAAASHGLGAAAATGKVAKMANAVFTSPRWRFIDANLRNKLADAMVSGNANRTIGVLSHIAAVQATKIPAALSSAAPP